MGGRRQSTSHKKGKDGIGGGELSVNGLSFAWLFGGLCFSPGKLVVIQLVVNHGDLYSFAFGTVHKS